LSADLRKALGECKSKIAGLSDFFQPFTYWPILVRDPCPCAHPCAETAFGLFHQAIQRRTIMSINKESDFEANIQIGPTSLGMVRIYIEGDGIEIPMDFDPEEAEEIAEEIRAAAAQARAVAK
jgi:hypothetical protein